MPWYGMLFVIFSCVVALELGVHIVYHARTRKGGLYDPPFNYLKDIFKKGK